MSVDKKIVQAIPAVPGGLLKEVLLSAVDVSAGAKDAGKLILIGPTGVLDPSLIGTLGGGAFNLDDGTFLAPSTTFVFDDGSF